MKITITEASNGYVIKDDEGHTHVVQQEADDEYYEARLSYKLLTMLQNILEYYPSKHDKINCRVTLEGDDDK
jgi:hypothetical protein